MVKKKNQGFTLIELLAVIVILAIIALIATPIILGIIEDARKDSFLRSVELVVSTTDLDVTNKNIQEGYTYEITDGNISDLEIGIKNTDGMNGTIVYNNEGKEQYAIHNGVYCVMKTEGMEQAEISKYEEGSCVLVIATPSKYFTYEEIDMYEIVDKDACQTVNVEMGAPSEEVTTICNNEPFEGFDGMTFTEFLSFGSFSQEEIDQLLNAGVIRITKKAIEITGYSEEGPKEVVIPSTIDGKQVLSIGYPTFGNKGLTSVTLPTTVTNISELAFSDNNFTTVEIPDSVTYIGRSAFNNNQITSITLSSNNSLQFIGEGAFCKSSISETSEAYQILYQLSNSAFICGK